MAATVWRKGFDNARAVLLSSAFRPLSTSSCLQKERVFVVGVGMTKFMKVRLLLIQIMKANLYTHSHNAPYLNAMPLDKGECV